MLKVVVVGLGYVGLANALLLAQKVHVVGVDISMARVEAIRQGKSPIQDLGIQQALSSGVERLEVTTNLSKAIKAADFILIATPTDYDDLHGHFDTSTVEQVVSSCLKESTRATIVIKSTIPVGYVEDLRDKFNTNSIFFSPEFLREGSALQDSLYPSRIIVGERTEKAREFANLLLDCTIKEDVEVIFTDPNEAESIKLFSNSYLAMRIAFFNELDSFALSNDLNTKDIISGMAGDWRIGPHYNNPSFGYGGYCLPKDSKQLLANYGTVPQRLIDAIVQSNVTRMKFLVQQVMKKNPKVIGIYRLVMKKESDNFRQSAILELIKFLANFDCKIIIYEPHITEKYFEKYEIIPDFSKFCCASDVIMANRLDDKLDLAKEKVFSRDIFGVN